MQRRKYPRGRHRARWRCYHARYKLQQRCAQHLIENKRIPGWEEWRVVRREYTVKLHGTSSRFDLLLTNDKGDEVFIGG